MDPVRDFDHRTSRWLALAVFSAYLGWTAYAIGLRSEHVVVSVLFVGLFWAGEKTARFAFLALPFVVVGFAYDNMRLLLPLRGEIHVADLYRADLEWFGIQGDSGPETLPAYFQAHTSPLLDFLCGLAYLTYLGESFLAAIWFYFRDRARLSRLAWAFLLVNLLGIATYILYPAAPPWYVEQHGLGPAVLDAAPSAAGAARFDELLGIGYFSAFYARNANVFGAMPSLHCAYPTIVFATTLRLGYRYSIPAFLYALWVAFSAVYLGHHYVLDVLAGILYGFLAYGAVVAVSSWRTRSSRPTALERDKELPTCNTSATG